MMRFRRRFLLEGGASPSLTLFCARGRGSAGLGKGEISSTSATGGGSEAVLDLEEDKKGKTSAVSNQHDSVTGTKAALERTN